MQPSSPSPKFKRYDDVRVWAGQLAGESRGEAWVRGGYAPPATVVKIERELEVVRSGGLICLIGSQGVGKSSALMALSQRVPNSIILKWRREEEFHKSFLESTRKTSFEYLYRYSMKLDRELDSKQIDSKVPFLNSWDQGLREQFAEDIVKLEREGEHYSAVPDIDWVESKLDKQTVRRVRQETCFEILFDRAVILVDTPDYSKTDRRRMAKDLESIHWLWNKIASSGGPSIVFAVQKEMSEGHFFLDKAHKFELEPLQSELMVRVYVHRFEGAEPFTEKSLLKLAQMSRGIFRRFLRYILLSLDLWEEKADRREVIDVDLVAEAVPVERLAEDMELELFALFPKQSDLRWLAVRLIMLLEEGGERKQSELLDPLGVKDYTLTRLLGKLEEGRYITRRREGNDKIVSLRS
jgi:DNA-binding transcriptional ArsR family regulator